VKALSDHIKAWRNWHWTCGPNW